MSVYMTAQRKKLFSFLQNHPDQLFTAKQLARLLKDSSISLSAIYRNLSFLEREGLINRVAKEGKREIFYQYLHAEKCRHSIHLSCTKCGKTFHMNADVAAEMLHAVSCADDFHIDIPKTVLYGLCKRCQSL